MGKQTKTGSKLSGKLINSFLLPNIGQSLFIQLELVYMSYFLTDLCGCLLRELSLKNASSGSWENTEHGILSALLSSWCFLL